MVVTSSQENGKTAPEPRHQRQFLIGLDAAEWELVRRWSGEGKLPTFRGLLETGTRAVLRSTAEQLPDTVWACLYTGVNPAKLAKYFYVQYDPATKGLRHVADDAIDRKSFWEHLSDAGIRVGVMDAPKFRLSRSLNGFQVTNWGAHATKTARAARPVGLLEEIERRFGRHPVGDCDAVDANPRALEGLARRVLEGIRLRGEATRWLMREREWDVFFTAFSETHCIGHHFWHWIDPTVPQEERKAGRALADAVEQVYRAVDREIGKILELVPEDALCMVFSGHGMGPIYHASWNLPEILGLLGFGREQTADAAAGRDARVNPWRVLKMVVPGWAQYRIKAMLPEALQHELLFRWYRGGERWDGCRCFAVPNNDSVGAIRLSVKGRDRDGLVAPGEEYRQVCRQIAEALYELTDPASGRPVVEKVTLTHEVFEGPFLDQLPDLTVLWDQTFRWEALHSPRFGTLRLKRQDARTGGHKARGFVIAAGPGIEPGKELTDGSIYDIAPTILRAAGVPAPPDVDGRPLPLQSIEATV
jgi:predicted AlkP superfamily phosphohydrolase/phosphomutase